MASDDEGNGRTFYTSSFRFPSYRYVLKIEREILTLIFSVISYFVEFLFLSVYCDSGISLQNQCAYSRVIRYVV